MYHSWATLHADQSRYGMEIGARWTSGVRRTQKGHFVEVCWLIQERLNHGPNSGRELGRPGSNASTVQPEGAKTTTASVLCFTHADRGREAVKSMREWSTRCGMGLWEALDVSARKIVHNRDRQPRRQVDLRQYKIETTSANWKVCSMPDGSYWFVNTCDYSKLVSVAKLPSLSFEQVEPFLIKLFGVIGIPHRFKTDNGSPFQPYAKAMFFF